MMFSIVFFNKVLQSFFEFLTATLIEECDDSIDWGVVAVHFPVASHEESTSHGCECVQGDRNDRRLPAKWGIWYENTEQKRDEGKWTGVNKQSIIRRQLNGRESGWEEEGGKKCRESERERERVDYEIDHVEHSDGVPPENDKSQKFKKKKKTYANAKIERSLCLAACVISRVGPNSSFCQMADHLLFSSIHSCFAHFLSPRSYKPYPLKIVRKNYRQR